MSELSKYLIKPIATSTQPSVECQKQFEAYQTAVKLLDANTSGDLISRQAVIDAFWELEIWISPSSINEVVKMIESVPSAERVGHWIEVCDTSRVCSILKCKCSECGTEYRKDLVIQYGELKMRYCSWCGARMKGDTE